ncbi:FAD-dependent oxidoreductase [Variovorax sp. J31P207]|uniref:FAD-dependent oxidoreductase n=1 Tax=Variovorax sp. J31P207 TaxID=3053510 RepID=UPI002574C57F|nr:FAD-dependent oxidoreductase [Variovorax sp. J31P207]MDM0070632.1 FAD-dependent oxidoreductase [Variovorax sp. J31P207]
MTEALVQPAGDTPQWDMEVDVLVIGAGACGMAAAIAAHDAGAQVAIVEKRDRPGGNSSLSTGSVPGAGSRFQHEAGIVDSAEVMVADLQRIAGEGELPGLTLRMARISAELCEWLVDKVGARMALITDYCHVGHTIPRLHAPVSRRGQDLVDDLVAAVERRDIPLAVNNPVQVLYLGRDGAVVGGGIGGPGVEPSRIGARSVILASNGFAANRALVAEYCGEIAGAEYFGALGSEGEAVLWARQLGARLANMQAYQGYAAVAYPHGSLLSWTTIEKGGLLINARGERFGNEDLGYSAYARHVLAQDTNVYAVFDERIMTLASKEDEFRELVEYGGLKKADSAAELAACFQLPADALQATLLAFNAAAAGQAPDAQGRTRFGMAPLTGRLWICRVTPGLFHTQGGLAVDDEGRVLREDGTTIAGLFAGGGAAAGISGRAGAGGYASGNGLLTAIGLGYLAGQAAAVARADAEA